MKFTNLIFPCFQLLIATFLISCEREDLQVQTKYRYEKPSDLGDGLSISDPITEGLDLMSLKVLMDSIDAGVYGGFHSMLILKNDKLVLEEYFNNWNQNDLHPMYSVTKSFASAIIGITIDKGFISSEQETLSNLLPSFNNLAWTDEKKGITLKHFLTMSSGFEWDEYGTPYDNPENPHYKMMTSSDWIKYLIELPMQYSPGEKYNYNTGSSTLFSVIVEEATGEKFDEFAHNHLLTKLDINDYSWFYMPGDYPATGGSFGGLHLRSRDMAKFGLLYMNDGKWGDEVVISQTWVELSLSPHINIVVSGDFTYGYQWWRNEKVKDKGGQLIQVPYGVGLGGQYIFLIKEHNLLIIITSDNDPSNTLNNFAMIENYILNGVTN
ncbi:MAG TPA: serine hydrolase [Cyclobacteriaceae bacterium]